MPSRLIGLFSFSASSDVLMSVSAIDVSVDKFSVLSASSAVPKNVLLSDISEETDLSQPAKKKIALKK